MSKTPARIATFAAVLGAATAVFAAVAIEPKIGTHLEETERAPTLEDSVKSVEQLLPQGIQHPYTLIATLDGCRIYRIAYPDGPILLARSVAGNFSCSVSSAN